MQITIHSGQNILGGACVEIKSNNTKILIDMGYPLTDEKGTEFDFNLIKNKTQESLIENNLLPDIKGIYEDETPEFDAVLLSHAHLDHYGFFNFINPEIPVYMSKVSNELLKIHDLFHNTKYSISDIKSLEHKKCLNIDDIKITPFYNNHSVPGSMSFLIEVEGKSIFYTGDFYAHGRCAHLNEDIADELKHKIDYLILEGTNVNEKNNKAQREEQIEEQLKMQFSKPGLNMVHFSTINIDRLVSVYKACLSNNKTLVIDPYTAFILDNTKFTSKNIPQYNSNNIIIYWCPHPYTTKLIKENKISKYTSSNIQFDEILGNKDKYVIKINGMIKKFLKNRDVLKNSNLAYCLWKGYFEKEKDFWLKNDVCADFIHTSGHADLKTLVDFVDEVKPVNIIPVHTKNRDLYEKFFNSNIMHDKVIRV